MALLLLPVCILPALEISVHAVFQDNLVSVRGRIEDIDDSELFQILDSGGTARLTWVFRLEGLDETLVRYVHRDFLESGYGIYGSDGKMISLAPGRENLIEALSVLKLYELLPPGGWQEGETLECRLFLEPDFYIPPLSIVELFGNIRNRSSWVGVSYPRAGLK